MTLTVFTLWLDLPAGPAPLNGSVPKLTQPEINERIRELRRSGERRPLVLQDSQGKVVGHSDPDRA
jgi:hypothetical protein